MTLQMNEVYLINISGKTDPRNVNPNLVLPLVDYVLPCLPFSVRKLFWCGVKYNKRDEFQTDFSESKSQLSSKQDEITCVCNDITDISKTKNGDVYYPEDHNTKL